ncbi:hypothetical protein D6D22_09535 [Aureobasidium pullulans]|uniref:Uncharacterized protein n=1 Tax=Aureobasidium pullulans TaxID=5580 RepID=A0A4S8X0N9_AURPU|nr:hypothetical protein D6D22_09535 [Aureobasidium pullulans]
MSTNQVSVAAQQAKQDAVAATARVRDGTSSASGPSTAFARQSDVVYINTTVTGSLMGHQTFQDAQNQVIRQELLVVRVPEMADRRVKEIDSVVRVPVPDHLGPWDSPHQAHLVNREGRPFVPEHD